MTLAHVEGGATDPYLFQRFDGAWGPSAELTSARQPIYDGSYIVLSPNMEATFITLDTAPDASAFIRFPAP